MSNNGIMAHIIDDGKKVIIVNRSTGEVISEDGVFKSAKVIKQQREYLDKHYQYSQQQYKLNKEFYWLYYIPNRELLDSLSYIELERFIFVSSYCEYKTNRLIVEHRRPMIKRDLKHYLGLSDSVFYRWYNKMLSLGYLIEKDRALYIPNNLVSRGEKRKGGQAIRIFIEEVRQLHAALKNTKGNKLGYIYKLIPYLNNKTNMLANEDGTLMQMEKISELLNINSKYLNKFIEDLLSLNKLYGRNIISFTLVVSSNIRYAYICISSLVMFGGNNVDMASCNFMFENINKHNKPKVLVFN